MNSEPGSTPRNRYERAAERVATSLVLAIKVFGVTAMVLWLASVGLDYVGADDVAKFAALLAIASLILAGLVVGLMFLLAMIFD
jgi:hypothetical protein